jgi:hypothetical protein
MLNKRSPFVPATLVSFGLLGMSAAQADDTDCYTNASISGNYAIVATYSANVALALGVRAPWSPILNSADDRPRK